MADAIVGPMLADVLALSSGRTFVLASAFYSEARLDATTISAGSADFMVRLNLKSIDDWVARAIAPDALLKLWERHNDVDLNVYCGPGAHAKIYVGDDAFCVGSANFTVRGLAGTTDEILWRERDPSARKKMLRALKEYKSGLHPLTREELKDYVDRNLAIVKKLQLQSKRSMEDSLPPQLHRPVRTGNYDEFLLWLSAQKSGAANEILSRANGKGQLSGHVRMNFYGIRQFLIAHPTHRKDLQSASPDGYRLCNDAPMEHAMKRFVEMEAADEGGLVLDTWRTYLPARSGGKPKSGGGTSGNLNRMMPLLANYLTFKYR